MRVWTDYPITQLGDTPNQRAPVRECSVIAYDGDKYATVVICGVETSFKAGYLYTQAGRCGDVPRVPLKDLERLPYRS